jgi:hypothetical protein
MGEANLNFEVRLRGEIIILKIKIKYHENQREKLILMIFFSMESLIHATTLLQGAFPIEEAFVSIFLKNRRISIKTLSFLLLSFETSRL